MKKWTLHETVLHWREETKLHYIEMNWKKKEKHMKKVHCTKQF
jgi:hypothetical protein